MTKLFKALIVILCTGMAVSCAKKEDDASTTSYAYAGSGSNYTATLSSDGSFVVTESDSGLNVTGTYTTLSSGFLELTVSSATMTSGTPPAAGDKAYALNIPGFVLILKPMGAGSQIITMLNSGTCPTTDLNLNWLVTNAEAGSDNRTSDRFGTFTWTAATGATALPKRYALGAPTTDLGAGTIGNFTCSAGIGTLGNVKMYLTSSGGALVNTDITSSTANQFILALPTSSISTAASLAGDYAGLIFDENAGSTIRPARATLSGTTLTVNSITVPAGTDDGNITNATVSLSSIDSPSAGFFHGQVNASQPIACMVQKNSNSSGKNIIFCIGIPPGGADTELFSAVFVSK